MSDAYKNSGVSLEAGYESVERIKKHIKFTDRLGVMGGIGGFGGLFDLSILGYKEPVLVSGTDGVGTKLMIAIMMDKHDTIGIDLVAMCVNDVLAQGALPMFFLDYIAVGKNYPEKIEQIVKGVSIGCKEANCALIGGETAEMPDMYHGNHYDVAGFTVGVVDKSKIITGKDVAIGDIMIGLPSSGIHSNGYSLVRKILFKDNNIDINHKPEELDDTVGNTILTPTKIYVNAVKSLLNEVNIKGISHITGGGFDENIPRCLNEGQGVLVYENSWPILPIFNYLEKLGNVPTREMFNVFNMGIGLCIIVSPNEVDKTMAILKSINEDAYVIGEVTEGQGVTFTCKK